MVIWLYTEYSHRDRYRDRDREQMRERERDYGTQTKTNTERVRNMIIRITNDEHRKPKIEMAPCMRVNGLTFSCFYGLMLVPLSVCLPIFDGLKI